MSRDQQNFAGIAAPEQFVAANAPVVGDFADGGQDFGGIKMHGGVPRGSGGNGLAGAPGREWIAGTALGHGRLMRMGAVRGWQEQTAGLSPPYRQDFNRFDRRAKNCASPRHGACDLLAKGYQRPISGQEIAVEHSSRPTRLDGSGRQTFASRPTAECRFYRSPDRYRGTGAADARSPPGRTQNRSGGLSRTRPMADCARWCALPLTVAKSGILTGRRSCGPGL